MVIPGTYYTPPHGDAVTFSYRPGCWPDGDSHPTIHAVFPAHWGAHAVRAVLPLPLGEGGVRVQTVATASRTRSDASITHPSTATNSAMIRRSAAASGVRTIGSYPAAEIQSGIYTWDMAETCAICGCQVHRRGSYARPSVKGRSHATTHHFVAERFYGRSKTRKGVVRVRIFARDPWGAEGKTAILCYECHEELLHNPVLLPEDLEALRRLVHRSGFSETRKPRNRARIAGRIKVLHAALHVGLQELVRRGIHSE